ncbi:MAG: protein-tyrosine-phosphatase [Planctomycetota bacterium]|jgi:protein-tyrosine-phosphatase
METYSGALPNIWELTHRGHRGTPPLFQSGSCLLTTAPVASIPRVNSELEAELKSASGIAFLCSGNMIRSAFAHLYARHLNCPLPVRSAGTIYENTRIHPETAANLVGRGVNSGWTLAFKPTHLSQLLPQLDERTIVFGMKFEHLLVLPKDPDFTRRSFLLTNLLDRDEELADPMFEGGLENVLDTIAECVDTLVAHLS